MESEQNTYQSPMMIDKTRLYCITPLSKYLALTLFVILPFIGGYVGYMNAPEKIVEQEKVIYKENVPIKNESANISLSDVQDVSRAIIYTPRMGDFSDYKFPVSGQIPVSWLKNPETDKLNENGLAPFTYMVSLWDPETQEVIEGKIESVYLNPLFDTDNLESEILVPFNTFMEFIGYTTETDRSCYGDVELKVESLKDKKLVSSTKFSFADVPGVNCTPL